MDRKECPMCGGTMRQQRREQTDRVPGSRETRTREVVEWICPDCDYFEEAEAS
jgi:YgiT-type zinc finger domain-containing protein